MKLVSSRSASRSRQRETRIAPLAVLPVFFDLKDKPVLVAGGTDAAAWKAHLLKAAGAKLTVHAEHLDEAFHTVFAPGDFVWQQQRWSAQSFAGAELAIGDIEDEDEAAAFAAAARAASVPVNVIDKPAFCQFQFGSIVNRSPLVVGISTNGAAPILGQAVRRRIEMLLPAALSQWATLASDIRDKAMTLLKPGAERRAFWERFAEAALRAAPDTSAVEGWLHQATNTRSGRVTLVGAGPGDAEYLTIKAVRALQAADVILFDDLVSGEVLELARREAKRILVGKRVGRPSCKQEEINEMMVSLARQGRHVVRLKSGDPMIFGRGGEEIARLHDEGIPVDVVPGITTALALAAELKVSLTHRDCAQSVRFVTGHARSGKLPENLHWQGMATSATTLVFYMAGRTAPLIAEHLLAEGMAPETPVVLAASVSRPGAQTRHTTLGALGNAATTFAVDGPVVIAIGDALARAHVAAITPERQTPVMPVAV